MNTDQVNIRYIVEDVDAAIAFYTGMLGFQTEMHPAAEFAVLTKGHLRLLLNRPLGKGGGGKAMPDGAVPAPGGWNRVVLMTGDLDTRVRELKDAGCRFRNEIVSGVGGSQILLQDPSGNLIELFEPGK